MRSSVNFIIRGYKPLSKPMMAYFPLDHQQHTSAKFELKHSNRVSKCRLKSGHFCGSASMCFVIATDLKMRYRHVPNPHYSDVIMSPMASQLIGVSIVYWTVCSGADQRKHQSSVSLTFVGWIHRWPHKGPVTRKIFPFDGVIMKTHTAINWSIVVINDFPRLRRQPSQW